MFNVWSKYLLYIIMKTWSMHETFTYFTKCAVISFISSVLEVDDKDYFNDWENDQNTIFDNFGKSPDSKTQLLQKITANNWTFQQFTALLFRKYPKKSSFLHKIVEKPLSRLPKFGLLKLFISSQIFVWLKI